MRPPDNECGEKIVEVLGQHEPHDMGIRELLRKTGLSRNGLYGWLNHFWEQSIVRNDPRIPIRLTEEALEAYSKGQLVISRDYKRKKNGRQLSPTDRKYYGRLLVLFISAHYVSKYKGVEMDENDIEWNVVEHRPSVKGDTTKKLERIYKPDNNLYPPVFENRINGCSLEIFRHLELSEEEAENCYRFFKNYKPYPVLIEKKYRNEIHHEIENKLLQDFLNRCLMAYVDVFSILMCYHKNDIFKEIKIKGRSQLIRKKEQIAEYKKYMDIWFGGKQPFYSIDVFIERLPLTDTEQRIKRAIRDIYKHRIFDDKLEGINKKYKMLQEKYPDIIEALLDTLFPSFFREIVRKEYMKNVTYRVT